MSRVNEGYVTTPSTGAASNVTTPSAGDASKVTTPSAGAASKVNGKPKEYINVYYIKGIGWGPSGSIIIGSVHGLQYID